MFTAEKKERSYTSFYDRPAPVAPIALTPRDIEIFQFLAEHRFASTRELQALFGQLIERRLRLLFRHRYIDRPDAQRPYRRYRDGGGSNAGIYALANRGANVLREHERLDDERDWSELNRKLSPTTLMLRQPHEDGIAEVRIAFKQAIATLSEERPNLRLRHADEVATGSAARVLQVPGGDRSIIPDDVLLLEEDDRRDALMEEFDRCSEPHRRFTWRDREYILDKYERYQKYARAKAYRAQFGAESFRVLTITTGSEERVSNLSKAAMEVIGGEGPNRFLATSLEKLMTTDPFDLLWMNAAGQDVRLVQ